jgi:predicted AlkP superfamily phosphohydrolase/phosphomutase
LIGRLSKMLKPDDTILIMSECGAGPIGGGVRLNLWLQQQGLLSLRGRSSEPSAKAKVLTKLRVAAQRYLPKNAFHLANSLPLKKWVQDAIVSDGIDWSHTVAYHRGKGEGSIYLNMVGRDRFGILRQSDYEHVRTNIIEGLTALIDPNTGKGAVAAVHRREDLFAGEYLRSSPDLIVEWDGFRYMPSEDLTSNSGVFGPRTREYMNWPTTGSHRPEGLLLANGPFVRRGKLDKPIELVDLAPTLLALLRCAVPSAMEGKPTYDIMTEAIST